MDGAAGRIPMRLGALQKQVWRTWRGQEKQIHATGPLAQRDSRLDFFTPDLLWRAADAFERFAGAGTARHFETADPNGELLRCVSLQYAGRCVYESAEASGCATIFCTGAG